MRLELPTPLSLGPPDQIMNLVMHLSSAQTVPTPVGEGLRITGHTAQPTVLFIQHQLLMCFDHCDLRWLFSPARCYVQEQLHHHAIHEPWLPEAKTPCSSAGHSDRGGVFQYHAAIVDKSEGEVGLCAILVNKTRNQQIKSLRGAQTVCYNSPTTITGSWLLI